MSDLETSITRRPRPDMVCCATEKIVLMDIKDNENAEETVHLS
jgi:hypothetical protein